MTAATTIIRSGAVAQPSQPGYGGTFRAVTRSEWTKMRSVRSTMWTLLVASVGKFFPARAGMAVFNVLPDPNSLSPWAGFAVLGAYAAMTLIVGGLLLVRRDA